MADANPPPVAGSDQPDQPDQSAPPDQTGPSTAPDQATIEAAQPSTGVAAEAAVAPATAIAVANASACQEPPFQLVLEPSDFIVFKTDKFPADDGAAIEVKLTNNTQSVQCYKVKCTSNEIFRVRPPLGYVKQGETVSIKFSIIATSAPDANKHFFAFYHVRTEDDSKIPRQVWTPTTNPDGVLRVPVKFLKNDSTPWTPGETGVGTAPPPESTASAPAAIAPGAVAPAL